MILILGVLLLQTILAVNLNVEKLGSEEAMIFGLSEPAVFKLNVTNLGVTDNFSFYTFFGMGISPSDSVKIMSGESKEIELRISPRTDFDLKGNVIFSYFIQGSDKSEIEEKLTAKIINLKDALKIESNSIDPESSGASIHLENKVNFNFRNMSVNLASPFFDFKDTIELMPYEKKTFNIDLDKSSFSKITAGFYTVSADLDIKEVSAKISSPINFSEKEIISEERKRYGLIISTTTIKKINEGNVPADSNIFLSENIISRIFTSFSEEPAVVERSGFKVNYEWAKNLEPGETYEVDVKTNWIIPFIVIFLIVLTVVFVRKYSKTDLILRKNVSFINAKGGEFALRVMVNVEARRFVENVKVFDRLPPLVKVFEKFGGIIPKRFNKTKRVFEWELGNLDSGERRTFSYVIYSRVGVLGRFALPETFATFEREGKPKEVSSNKAFFLAEQKSE